ncbi:MULTISPECIES: hypothetical protein [unclassified Brevundimonas]|uniref:hypothetical protein n=1 Tax=unclassified Brevundimonas TaxID=2622653 RepID=UPI0025BE8492|nr:MULTISPECIES: hypothetical protein [unclassified Brevundimonas]
MREQSNSLKIVTAVAPGAYAADVAPVTIDRQGFASATFAIHVGVGGITFTGTNKIEFVLEESYDGEDWNDVLAKDVAGLDLTADDGIVLALKAAHAAPTVTKFGYIGDARYVRLTPDFSGTHGTPTPLSAVAIFGRPAHAPVA